MVIIDRQTNKMQLQLNKEESLTTDGICVILIVMLYFLFIVIGSSSVHLHQSMWITKR